MAVFSLSSDKYFIRKDIYNSYISVYECEEVASVIEMIDVRFPRIPAKELTYVPGKHSGLEVFGVTFSGVSLATLVRDLTLTGKNYQCLYVLVNRQGVCYVNIESASNTITWLRIDGHFCWSKYGVVKPIEVQDSGNETGLVDRPLAIMAAESSDDHHEEEDIEKKETKKSELFVSLRNLLEEKNKEVASIKAVLSILSSE